MNSFFDIVIIGAGASGFSCAASALARGKTVAILEHNDAPLKKVMISGGGRCNFTNTNATKINYLSFSDTNNIVEKALKSFSPNDFIKMLNKHKIDIVEKNKGQFFTASSAQKIIDMLKKETQKAKIFYKISIDNISRDESLFEIKTNKGPISSKSVVVATGGMSYSNIGASDLGYKIAKQFGLKITPYKPALVPLNLDNYIMKLTIKLKGISIPSIVECNGYCFRDNILFTHFGLSGPAILQASLYWNSGNKIKINLLPDIDIANELKKLRDISKGKKISSILSQYFPKNFVDFLIEDNDCFVTEISNKNIEKLYNKINKWEILPIGTQGFRLAEVTSGGVDLNEIKDTFETNKVKNLFFIGEVLDVTGQLGGYNLQWAWSSGYIAGKNA